jgi:ABC-type tungstate transport system substrate-binding protein
MPGLRIKELPHHRIFYRMDSVILKTDDELWMYTSASVAVTSEGNTVVIVVALVVVSSLSLFVGMTEYRYRPNVVELVEPNDFRVGYHTTYQHHISTS